MQNNSTITAEMVAESEADIFSSAVNVGEKGLQQYFTPSKFAEFIAEIFLRDGRQFSVCDLTAGSGELLKPFNREGVECHGVEIDRLNADKCLGVVRADLPRIAPYLNELGVKFSKFVLNPPFGLKWQYEGREWNSANLTLKIASDLSQSRAEGCLICHENNWSEIESLAQELPNVHFYSAFRVAGLFSPASECPSVVAFWLASCHVPPCRLSSQVYEWSKFDEWDSDWFDLIVTRRANNGSYAATARYSHRPDNWTSERLKASASAARAEASSKVQRFNLEIEGGSIRVYIPDIKALRLIESRGENYLAKVRRWSGLPFRYFALNTEAAKEVKEAISEGLLTAEPGRLEFRVPELHEGGYWIPGFEERIDRAVAESTKYVAPFYPIKETMRLGYLTDLKQITCKATDSEAGYFAGETYPLKCYTVNWEEAGYKPKTKIQDGAPVETVVEVKREGKTLRVKIGGRVFTESPDDIIYIAQHFDLPDPGDITAHYREAYLRYVAEFRKLESPRFKFRDFQRDDLARLCCRDGAVLAWEQGLGKMVGGLSWALVRRFSRVLIICPQDLIKQWTDEARDKFGVELIRLETVEQARLLSKQPRSKGAPEFYIVHYEALSRKGTIPRSKWLKSPSRSSDAKGANEVIRWRVGIERGVDELGRETRHIKYNSSRSACPHCHQSLAWSGGVYCDPKKKFTIELDGERVKRRGCGHVHYVERVHNMAHYLKKAFSAVIVDEGTKIKNASSLMGQAVQSLRPKARLVLTGTPVKNFLYDSFYLLLWSAGMSPSEAFPYGYADCMTFLRDYCVIEREMPSRSNGRRMGEARVLPEISNLNQLWKVLAANVLRRRKSETGEDLVSKKLVPVRVPFSIQQQKTYAWWLRNFGEWFVGREDTTLKDAGLANALAGILGLLWKLRQSASVPAMFELERYDGKRSSSNATPKLVQCLELIRDSLEAGEPCVVFNAMRAANVLIQAELNKAGIKSRIIDGEVKPADRASAIADFKEGKFQILLAGIDAINLGHNLENAKRAIVYSLPYDLATFDQAINRVHRLTSSEDVIVHIILTEGSIDEKMWELIERKGRSAGLAIDGALGFDEVEELDQNKLVQELREEWSESNAIPESKIAERLERMWEGLHLIEREGKQVKAAAGALDTFDLSSLDFGLDTEEVSLEF